jgi:diguanylate cyclase (GGDEF)-like protein
MEKIPISKNAAKFTMPAAILRAGMMALIFFVNSAIVIYASEFSDGAAAIWSANAILLFTLIVSPKSDHLAYYVGAFAASIGVNLYAHFSSITAFSFSLANMIEVALAMWMLRRTQNEDEDLIAPHNLAHFGLVALAAPVVSASCAVLGSTGNIAREWVSWYLSDALGLLLVVPSLWVIRHSLLNGKSSRWSWSKFRQCGLMFALVTAAAMAVFLQDTLPILFIIALPLLMAVLRHGAMGAVCSTSLVAVISIAVTLLGHGPIALWDVEPMYQIFLLQGFLACQLVISLPVASILADRDAKALLVVDQERELRKLAEQARRAAETVTRKNALMMAKDDLTGLNSRRRILQRLDHAMGTAIKGNERLSVALFDVDNFKRINDVFGHSGGDEVLRLIGEIVNGQVSRRFPVGRIGGEEFLMLLPGLTADQASRHAEQLRIAIMQGTGPGTDTAATVSIGVATAHKGKSIKTLLGAADAALYEAKAAGRNRMKLAA